MESYLTSFLQNIADQYDKTGGALFGEGRKRRRIRKGRGLITDTVPINDGLDYSGDVSGNGMYGLGMYGLGRKKRKMRRKSAFNIGKYSKAIANGYTKEEAKRMARK